MNFGLLKKFFIVLKAGQPPWKAGRFSWSLEIFLGAL
jgi:hypothetical protein